MAMSFFLLSLLSLLLVQLPVFTSAQSSNNITLGSFKSSLHETPYWTSPSGEFAFGFHSQQDAFLLAIWFDKVPLKTIVWTANKGQPVPRGSTVELTSDGIISLISPNRSQIWKAQATDNSQIAYAALLDTGNFVLVSQESATVWESFTDPTDTLLPTQTLKLNQKLTSRLTAEDYSIGRFQLSLQTDGNLVLYTIARPAENSNEAYWASDTLNNGSQLVFNQSGYFYLTLKSGRINYYPPSATPDSTTNFYQRVTLDFDGVLRRYTYPKSSPINGRLPGSWSTSWSLPENICTTAFGSVGSGVCGFNSYCRVDQNQRPECLCPPGYTFRDPKNTFGGCKQNFLPQNCLTNDSAIKDGFEMRPVTGTDWPFDDYEGFKSVSESWCIETCLNDCFCAVAIVAMGDSNCWLKKFPLSRGYQDPNSNRKALIKVGASLMLNVPTKDYVVENKDNNWIIPGSVVLGISVLVNLMLLLLVFYSARHKKQRSKKQKESVDSGSSDVNLRSFTYKELEEATDGFKEELGKGAFSTVYKGVLKSDYGDLVAVKKLERVPDGFDKEFTAEVNAIGKTNHKNLVQLLGFCNEEAHRLLVYEFMKNGSLENFLFGSSRLAWSQRIQISIGIARGLVYLHEYCSNQIIHCDIKPQNILLDDSYTPRISDFGLAKLLKSDQTRTTTGIRGTKGYVAPEWFKNKSITAKIDVYSFGIMLLEIICCRRNITQHIGEEDIEVLSDFAYECCEGKALHLLVENDEAAKNDGKNLERLVMVSLWCIQEEPSLRPSMKKVTQMLEGATDVSMPPDLSSFMSSIG